MPTHPVKVQPGCYQWGHHGKIYCGKGAKEKADRQGRAVHATGWREHGSEEGKDIPWTSLTLGFVLGLFIGFQKN